MPIDVKDKELYADSITFAYTAQYDLLTGVYVSCKIGDIIALLGRNGSGKSTLMKILFGSLIRKNGLIIINGVRVQKGYLTKKICYLPQASFLPPYLRVKQAIKLMVADEDKQRAIKEDALVIPIISQKIAETSVGERRYLELLILLQMEADFYLLDEPFSGVAPYMKDRIQALICLHQSQRGFIISDHHYNSVLAISTSILLLQNGGCRTIKDKKDLEHFYVPEGTFGE